MEKDFSLSKVLIAHRAACETMVENTFSSLVKMHKKGANYFEIDCYLMKDGNIAVLHDASLKKRQQEKVIFENLQS